MNDRKKPTKPGFYWARRNEENNPNWDCIVRITGTAPFLSYKSWIFLSEVIDSGGDPEKYVFGPKIRDPKTMEKK